MGRYDDIINLEHQISNKHPRMSLEARSAQFAPFAALTGHSEAIKETARLTNERVELDEEAKNILDNKLQLIKNRITENPLVSITYFIEDTKKIGGEYVTITDNIKKIDFYNQIIILKNGTKISICDIFDITGEILYKNVNLFY